MADFRSRRPADTPPAHTLPAHALPAHALPPNTRLAEALPADTPPADTAAPAPPPGRRKRALRVLAWLLALGLLAWLLRQVDWALLARQARQVPLPVWALATALWLGSYGWRALRLRGEWSALPQANFNDAWRLTLGHNAALLLLPMRSGEAGYLWLLKRHWGVPPSASARSLLALRLQDAVVLALAAIGALLPWPPAARLLLVLAIALALAAAMPALAVGAQRHWPRWQALERQAAAPGALAAPPQPRQQAGRPVAQRLGGPGLSWFFSAANWACKLAAVALLLGTLLGLPADVAWRGALGGELAGALPLQGPAGLGSYEAGVWLAAQAALPPGAAAVRTLAAAALLVHVWALAVALAAAALWRPRPPGA